MIEGFRGEYSFLSNFTRLDNPIVYQGLVYCTTEHFYQAMKTRDISVRVRVSKHPSRGLKTFSKTLPLREDWEDVKDKVMRKALEYKFSKANPRLMKLLKDTGSETIQEGNWWGDKYWGVCLKTGEGKNVLGIMLMDIRDALEDL